MQRFLSIATLLCAIALLASSPAALIAQTAATQTAAPGIVTISFNTAVLQTAEAQRDLGALQTKYAPRQAKIKALNDEVEGLQKQLQATGDKLSDAERASREQSLSTKTKQLQRDGEDFRNDSQSESQQIFQGIAQKVYAFLQTYAQQHGYSVVVERGTDSAPVVWYAANNLDITAQVAKAYDAKSGVTSPAASKPSVPTAPTPQQTSPASK